MQPEQEIVVGWIERVAKLRKLKLSAWAEEAHVSPTTLTRGVKDEYPSVTTIPVLHKLAQAAEVPSLLDWLAEQPLAEADAKPPRAEPMTKQVADAAAEQMAALAVEVLRDPALEGEQSKQEALGEALSTMLQGLSEHYAVYPEARLSPGQTQGMLQFLKLRLAN